jgi:hypothetical protein
VQRGQAAQGVRGAKGESLVATSQQGCAQHHGCQIPTGKKKRERSDDPARKTGGIAGVRKGMGGEGGLQGFHQSIPHRGWWWYEVKKGWHFVIVPYPT